MPKILCSTPYKNGMVGGYSFTMWREVKRQKKIEGKLEL